MTSVSRKTKPKHIDNQIISHIDKIEAFIENKDYEF